LAIFGKGIIARTDIYVEERDWSENWALSKYADTYQYYASEAVSQDNTIVQLWTSEPLWEGHDEARTRKDQQARPEQQLQSEIQP
jgi:hypothetical protein